MFNAGLNYTNLITGVIVMIFASYVFYRIQKGSKSTFAYVLIVFSFSDGANNFATFFIDICRHPVQVGGQTHYGANEYAELTFYYLYLLGSLQSWIFSMKYLESALIYSLTSACISPRAVRILKGIVTIFYTLAIVALYIWGMVTWPGYTHFDSSDQLLAWFQGDWNKITNALWFLINFISTVITIFSVSSILGTTKKLQSYNSKLSINRRTMIIHSVILSLQSLATVFEAIMPFIPFFYDRAGLIQIVLSVVDVIVQLAISFICLTMGSHENLRQFKITLDFTQGVTKVVFRQKENLDEIDAMDPIEQEITESNSSLNFDMIHPRGESIENEQGCNEIVQQFLNGLESFVQPSLLRHEIEEAVFL